MCDPATLTALGFSSAATTAGATAGAATAASAAGAAGAAASAGGFATTLQTIGTLLSVGGSLTQGINAARVGSAQAKQLAAQRATEAQLTAVRDQRTRSQFATEIRRQAAELAGRGISLDSPTAILLGQNAARELSFESQAIRSGGAATQIELSASQRAARARGLDGFLRGTGSAAATALSQAPKLFPGLRG